MSLINQALKKEQLRRHAASAPVDPMVTRVARHSGGSDKLLILLVGFVGCGLLLAVAVTAIIYFGNAFLDSNAQSPQAELASSPLPAESISAAPEEPAEVEQPVLIEEAPTKTDLAARAYNQGIVDGFTVQGIRKSGQNSRVFMNGRIQKLGDVIDIENGIRLIGFTEFELVFEDSAGNRYSKPL